MSELQIWVIRSFFWEFICNFDHCYFQFIRYTVYENLVLVLVIEKKYVNNSTYFPE